MRLLIIKIGSIGDVVHTLPTLEVLSSLEPRPEITWVVGEGSFPLLDGDPRIDRVILFKAGRFKELLRSLRLGSFTKEAKEFLSILRGDDFDLLIDLQGDLKSALISLLSRSQERVTFCDASEGNPLFLKRIPSRRDSIHVVERYLDTVRVTFRVKVERAPYARPFVSEEARGRVKERFGELFEDGRVVSLIPASSWESKTWFRDRWESLADFLISMGFKPVVLGGPDAEPFSPSRAVNLAGKLSLSETCAFLERSTLTIGVDTGPTHISASLGVPTLALFGPTPPWRNSPWGARVKVLHRSVGCNPCRRRSCPERTCMSSIEVEEVLNGVSSLALQEG